MATVQTTNSPISSALQSCGTPSAFTAHIRAAGETREGSSIFLPPFWGPVSLRSPPGITEPTSCSVRTDSFSSESIRITPWLRSCMDKTPRPGGATPSSTGLEEQKQPIRSEHS